jgi:hypothetical protein
VLRDSRCEHSEIFRGLIAEHGYTSEALTSKEEPEAPTAERGHFAQPFVALDDRAGLREGDRPHLGRGNIGLDLVR